MAKFTEASSMNTVHVHSTAGIPNAPTLALRVENPPVPIVENACARASTRSSPNEHRRTACKAVRTM